MATYPAPGTVPQPTVEDGRGLVDVLRWQAENRGDEPFLVFEDPAGRIREVSYHSALLRATATAAALRDRGVGAGDRVLVMLPNCAEFCDLWFGTALLGAALVPLNPVSTASEIAWVLTDASATVCVAATAAVDRIEQALTMTGRAAHVLVVGSDGPDRLDRLDRLVAAADRLRPPAHRPQATEVAAVLYTSGTTSRPKGVMVSHANYLRAGEAVAGHLRIRPDDRWLVVLPLFHANAQYYCVMSGLVTGASVAIASRFTASGWSRQCREFGATLASLFAAPVRMILAAPPDELDAKNCLRATLFAQNLTAAQVEDFGSRFGTPLLQLYGMTETIAPATCNPLYGPQRPDSIGRPLLGRRLRVVDESGRDVPAGAVGELIVHGEPGRSLMSGYLNRPDATAEVFDGNWLHTGDLVRAGDDGYLYFVDRSKDMIKRSGENVAASEVERVVNEHPAVFESAAIGVPDPVRDEAVVVYVVLHPDGRATEPELITWCAQRLAPFKVPSGIRFIQQLPRTSVGKVRKTALRQQVRHENPEGVRR